MNETIQLFNNIKPYLDEGYGFNKAVQKIKGTKGNYHRNRWYKDLKKYCIQQGYETTTNKRGEAMIRVIERTDEEYMNDIRELYELELKPLIDSGMSLTSAFMKMGVAADKRSRKYKELRRMALDDGYVLRGWRR